MMTGWFPVLVLVIYSGVDGRAACSRCAVNRPHYAALEGKCIVVDPPLRRHHRGYYTQVRY